MRLTKARCERWTKEAEKARALLLRIEEEQRSYYGHAKGGRLSDLTAALNATKAAKAATNEALRLASALLYGEIRRG